MERIDDDIPTVDNPSGRKKNIEERIQQIEEFIFNQSLNELIENEIPSIKKISSNYNKKRLYEEFKNLDDRCLILFKTNSLEELVGLIPLLNGIYPDIKYFQYKNPEYNIFIQEIIRNCNLDTKRKINDLLYIFKDPIIGTWDSTYGLMHFYKDNTGQMYNRDEICEFFWKYDDVNKILIVKYNWGYIDKVGIIEFKFTNDNVKGVWKQGNGNLLFSYEDNLPSELKFSGDWNMSNRRILLPERKENVRFEQLRKKKEDDLPFDGKKKRSKKKRKSKRKSKRNSK